MKCSYTPLLVLFGLIGTACGQEPEPIDYGSDDCHYCQMRIIDPRFGSEAITAKGRTYKFDSVECLVHYLNESDEEQSIIVVTDYAAPGHLIPAASATFLISESMPSPMGADLTAFEKQSTAESHLASSGGKLFTWKELKAHFN